MSQYRQPMGDGGAETDILTGRPRENIPNAGKRRAVESLESTVQEGIRLSRELRDTGSDANAMLQGLLKTLEDRVEQLTASDSACQALINVLAHVGHRVHIGPEYARRRLAQYFGPDFVLHPVPAPGKRDTGKRKT